MGIKPRALRREAKLDSDNGISRPSRGDGVWSGDQEEPGSLCSGGTTSTPCHPLIVDRLYVSLLRLSAELL